MSSRSSTKRRLRRFTAAAVAPAVLALLSGCLPGLNVVPLQSVAAKPSNVAVFLSVETNDGKPVSGLTADRFSIFEDGAHIPSAQTKQVILAPRGGVARYTLLLLDMSGTSLAAKEAGDVVKTATALTDKIDKSQSFAAYTYDGSADLNAVIPFGADAGSQPISPSRGKGKSSLDDAMVGGLKILQRALAAEAKAVKIGTVVLVTELADRDTHTLSSELKTALAAPENAKVDLFALGLGTGLDAGRLGDLGRSGTVTEADPENLSQGFEEVATKIAASAGRYYLLSYCTPARSGAHEVRIEAHSDAGLVGDLTTRFTADGFGSGCDPDKPAGFDVMRPSEVERKKEAPKKGPKKGPASAPPAPPATPSPAPPAPAAAPSSDPFQP